MVVKKKSNDRVITIVVDGNVFVLNFSDELTLFFFNHDCVVSKTHLMLKYFLVFWQAFLFV